MLLHMELPLVQVRLIMHQNRKLISQFDTLLQRDRFLQLHGRRNYEVLNKNFKACWYILAVMVQQPLNPYEKRRERDLNPLSEIC
jgi:hypothetical protein